MKTMHNVELDAPYLILIGDVEEPEYAKTGFGMVQWRPELVAGQLRFSDCPVDLAVPDMTIDEAVACGARSLIIGVAPVGGRVPDSWWAVIEQALSAGLDIVSGLHLTLSDYPGIKRAADKSGSRLIDIRKPPANLQIATGRKRTGKRVLMVGTDCAIGKKYSALSLAQAMQKNGLKASFRASGQTGILISGSGIAIDAVVADFIAGAAEAISPDNDDDHWDVVEGQGSLFHPAYGGVSLGLLHGTQPDAIVVCHAATRDKIAGWPNFHVPSISECIEHNLRHARRTNPNAICVGLAINTSTMSFEQRSVYFDTLESEYDYPCVDPIVHGCDPIVNEIVEKFA